MKRSSILALAILVLPVLSSAQSNDDLLNAVGAIFSSADAGREKSTLSKASKRYNADQPNVSLKGEYIVFRAPGGWEDWSDKKVRWFVSSMEAAATAIGAIPVWDTPGIKDRSYDLRDLRDDDEVDQSTLPTKGSIKAAWYIAEIELIEFEKSQQFGGFLGSFWRGAGFEMSRETAYAGATLTIRKQSGEALAVYKTLNSASTADNVSASIVGGFFGDSAEFYSSEDSEDANRFRARENNIRDMVAIFKQKCK